MASGTYAYSLPNASIVTEAYERCGLLPPELTRHHWISARRTFNLLLVRWANRDGVNLWKVMGPTTIALVPGTPTYNLPSNTVAILDAYYTTVNGGGAGINTDRILVPMSRDEYAEYPNKLQQGPPSLYWHNKEMTTQQTLTLYENPQFGAPGYLVNYYWLSQMMDANLASGENPDVPYLGLAALSAGVAFELAKKPSLFRQHPIGPDLYQRLGRDAAETWEEFSAQNREDAPMILRPDTSGYWR